MKSRPWLTVYILLALVTGILFTIPLGVTGDNEGSWDTYQSTWTQIPVFNLTHVEIYHPVNGSLVSNNQKLQFIVVPFDADELIYKIDVYKNDILMYTCNQEKVYDLNIYTNNPINQKITIKFKHNSNEILTLEYIAILTGPSLNADFTEQWLQYQAQKENESLSGREVVNIRDEKLNDMNLVVTTGIICIGFTLIAGIIVIVFKLLSMMNAFTGIMMFITGLFWINGIRQIDQTMRALPVATSTDITVYYTSMLILTLFFIFAMSSYIIGYKIGKSRLTPWKFWGFGIKDRKITEYETVIHQSQGRYFWWIQNSWDAFKQAILKKQHPLVFEHGDLTDTFQLEKGQNIPENNDNKKEFRAFEKILRSLYSKMAFKVMPLETANDGGEVLEETEGEILEDTEPLESEPEIKSILKKDNKVDERYNFKAWKYIQDNNPFKSDIPIIMLNGDPEFIDVYNKEDYRNIEDNLNDIRERAEKGFVEDKIGEVERSWKDFISFKKKKPKPLGKAVVIKLSNADNYGVLHFLDSADYMTKLSSDYVEKDRALHKANISLEVRSMEKAKEKYEERDRQIKELKERKEKVK